MEELLKNLKIRGDLHRRLKMYVAERGEGIQELTERVLEAEISGTRPSSVLDGLTASQRKLAENYIHALRESIRPEMLQVIEVALAAIRRELADSAGKSRKAS